jgi:hypothetical protein
VSAVQERLARVLATHFDPRWGSPFWLERAAALGFDPRREIRTVADLARLGPMPLDALASRPLEHFLPRRFHDCPAELVTAETGGTTGPPRRTAFLRDEFVEAFVAPFLAAARLLGFPRRASWLFVGPSGPHPIGKAARACAQAMDSIDPFSVDFDPRWARRLPPDSLARRRYLEHVLEQATAILASQRIGVVFATPPVLAALAGRLDPERRAAIAGIHLGGLAAAPGFWKELAGWFPNAKVMGGYGNSLAGMCPQLAPDPSEPPEYFPHGARLVLGVEPSDASPRGRVRFHRLDESCFLPNVLERDEAGRAAPPAAAGAAGFTLPGLRDPRPPETAPEAKSPGLY